MPEKLVSPLQRRPCCATWECPVSATPSRPLRLLGAQGHGRIGLRFCDMSHKMFPLSITSDHQSFSDRLCSHPPGLPLPIPVEAMSGTTTYRPDLDHSTIPSRPHIRPVGNATPSGSIGHFIRTHSRARRSVLRSPSRVVLLQGGTRTRLVPVRPLPLPWTTHVGSAGWECWLGAIPIYPELAPPSPGTHLPTTRPTLCTGHKW